MLSNALAPISSDLPIIPTQIVISPILGREQGSVNRRIVKRIDVVTYTRNMICQELKSSPS